MAFPELSGIVNVQLGSAFVRVGAWGWVREGKPAVALAGSHQEAVEADRGIEPGEIFSAPPVL